MAQNHPDLPPAACELSTADTYNGCYSEDIRVCQRLSSDTEAMYGQSGSQLNQRMLPMSSHTQPSLMSLPEQMNMSGSSHGYRRVNTCLPQGQSQHMLWTTQGQISYTRSADDLESDSGLSLGSSPSLASPDNAVGSTQGHQSVVTYSDGEPDSMTEFTRRVRVHPSDYQGHAYLHQGTYPPYCSSQPALIYSQPNAPTLRSQGDASALDEIHKSGLPGRGSSQHDMFTKIQGSISSPGPQSRDERRAMALKIPFPMEKIINLPVDDFNELLTQYTLTDSQLALVRDIRRRGKNKVAAQNCRKRKLESIIHLERELGQLQTRREDLAQERLKFQHSLAFIKCRLTDLYTEVFSHLRDENGQPYSIDEYSLQQTPNGKTYLVPHTNLQNGEQS